MKKEGVLNEIKFVDPWFVSCKKVFEDINIDEFIDKQHNGLSMGVANWIHEGSGWIVHSILRHQLLFQKELLANEVHIFNYSKNLRAQCEWID